MAAAESSNRLLRQTQLGDAVMNVPLAAVVIDPGTRTYLAVNDFMCRISGYHEDELVGEGTGKLSGSDFDDGRWARLLSSGFETGTSVLRHKDGSLIPTRYIASVTKVGGLEFLVGFFWERDREPSADAPA